MNSMVYGGCYRETCISPVHNALAGSGLRASEVLSHIAPSSRHCLATFLYPSILKPLAGILSALRNIDLHPQCPKSSVEDPPLFEYLNPLATPRLRYCSPKDESTPPDMDADSILVFGTLEKQARISARIAVFDPQSPGNPRHFWENGSTADHCALVLNHNEAMRLAGENSIFAAVRFLQRNILGGTRPPYEVIVVKMAHAGCWVCTSKSIEAISAYRTSRVFSIGSGDVFSAAFYAKWALAGDSPCSSADFASQFTARYCASGMITNGSPDHSQKITGLLEPLPKVDPDAPIRRKTIYLAGPFFSQGEIALIEHLREVLQTPWTMVFSPFHDVGFGPSDAVYKADIDALESADLVFAVLTGTDPGTLFEIGYAVKAKKPIFCLAEAVLPSNLTMIEGSGAQIDTDITSAVYKTLWATLE